MDQVVHAASILKPYALWLSPLVLILPLAYWYMLPKPLPGIPYDPESARRIMGDIPKLIKHAKAIQEASDFFALRCLELNSPIVQLFVNGIKLRNNVNVLVVSDLREIENILTHRTKEFDRADMSNDGFSTVINEATIAMPSHDRFKAQRKLWAGTMTPEFLSKIAPRYLYDSGMNLVHLWQRKEELAQGCPFDAAEDLRFEGFDAIWAFEVGRELGTIKAQLQHLQSTQDADVTVPTTTEKPVVFPKGEAPELYQAIAMIIKVMESLAYSIAPQISFWVQTHMPGFRRRIRAKEEHMDGLIADARAEFENKQSPHADETVATSAMDQVLRRLHNSKIGTLNSNTKEPDRHLKDELFLMLLAGYETTSTSLSWAVKYLAAHPAIQDKLRNALRENLGDSQTPSGEKILSTSIPYLDATINEILRCSMTSGGASREVKCDTSILGYPVPKGTIVILSTNGNSYLYDRDLPSPADEKRSESTKQYSGVRGQQYSWPLEGRRDFRPERWLRTQPKTDEKGAESEEVVFDEHAGPSLPFGLGPRGCFGRRLAMVKLRITLTLMVLAFEFLEVKGTTKDEKGKEVDMASWAGREKLARMPQVTYVRLRAL
ncbi:MAG: hypothetical protein Q9159_002018 [Coniocarpon cinnabarinum]